MKIISKYKDFYDYLVFDNEPDMVYVRKPFFITDNLNKLFPRVFKHNYGYSYNNKGNISINIRYFGIYPYVYGVPYVNIAYRTIANYIEFYHYFFSSKDVENIITKEDLINFCKDKVNKYINSLSYPFNTVKLLTKYEFPTYSKNISKDFLKTEVFKIEAKEVFEYIEAPVFCKLDNIDYHAYSDLKDYKGKEELKYGNRYYIANCSFEKLGMDMLKYWIDELKDINTYNNIENFLWSMKTEPISIPDNKTKIISHGFDLKTSFRNM